MTASNVFCLPSHSEGCPNVVLEALSCDRQVVATAVGGVPELINKDCGYLVPAGNVGVLADALAKSLQSDPEPGSISQRFQRGWDKVAEETFESCTRLLRTAVRANT
jgi:glycosyltransferase involved in cell wall biosynthesis